MSTTNPATSSNNSIASLFAPILGEEAVKNKQIQAALKHVAQALELSGDSEEDQITELKDSLINACNVYADTTEISKPKNFNAQNFKQIMEQNIKTLVNNVQAPYIQSDEKITQATLTNAIAAIDRKLAPLELKNKGLGIAKSILLFGTLSLAAAAIGVTIGPLFGATICATIAAKSLVIGSVAIKAPALLAIGASLASLGGILFKNQQYHTSKEIYSLKAEKIQKYEDKTAIDIKIATEICQEVFGTGREETKKLLTNVSFV